MVTACNGGPGTPSVTPEGGGEEVVGKPRWTFMVYVDGDNNLEGAALDDFGEMASVGSTGSVNILVQMDRIPGHTVLHGDWTGTRRFLVGKGDLPSKAPLQDLGEQNMGDPKVLRDFVEWGITSYPAEHYLLSIWNHGNGWRDSDKTMEEVQRSRLASRSVEEVKTRGETRGVCTDETDDDILYTHEVHEGLADAMKRLGASSGETVKLDVLGFDACLMGMIEVAYEVRKEADYLVASEWLEPNDGWPYDTILADLVAHPDRSPRDLAGVIVDRYADHFTHNAITQAAIDLSGVPAVAEKVDGLAAAATSEWDKLKEARGQVQHYHKANRYTYWGVDLWDLAEKIRTKVSSSEIKAAASELQTAVESCVVKERHRSTSQLSMDGSHGMAIYFPETRGDFDDDPHSSGYVNGNTWMPVQFVKDHGWDEWLQKFYDNNY
jgi:hypothetical protein